MRLKGRVSKLETKTERGAAPKPSTIIIRSAASKKGKEFSSQAITALILTASGCKTLQREPSETEEVFMERLEFAQSADLNEESNY